MPRFSQSRLAAKLQDVVSKRRDEAGLYEQIAAQLPLPDTGRLLDVGTGSGLQLGVIHDLKPYLELYGLDISSAAIRVARRNLEGIEVDLRAGSIESTSFGDDRFDIVTCHSSMSYWENPVSCFDEIHRILKPGGAAVLFEPQKDIDVDEAIETIRAQLADKSRFRRFLATSMNRLALQRGRSVGLTLYSVDELAGFAMRSRFGESYSIDTVTLLNLPIFHRITLSKQGKDPSSD